MPGPHWHTVSKATHSCHKMTQQMTDTGLRLPSSGWWSTGPAHPEARCRPPPHPAATPGLPPPSEQRPLPGLPRLAWTHAASRSLQAARRARPRGCVTDSQQGPAATPGRGRVGTHGLPFQSLQVTWRPSPRPPLGQGLRERPGQAAPLTPSAQAATTQRCPPAPTSRHRLLDRPSWVHGQRTHGAGLEWGRVGAACSETDAGHLRPSTVVAQPVRLVTGRASAAPPGPAVPQAPATGHARATPQVSLTPAAECSWSPTGLCHPPSPGEVASPLPQYPALTWYPLGLRTSPRLLQGLSQGPPSSLWPSRRM